MKIDILKQIHHYSTTTPGQPAHIFKEEVLSYGELWEKSGTLAAYLAENFPEEGPIGVLGNKSKSMVISFLACTRSGHAYIPLDESLPDHRVDQILTGAKALTVINTLPDRIPAVQSSILSFSLLGDILSATPKSVPDSLAVGSNENYYILFTSGSTGTPKGVQILRSNLEDFVEWTMNAYRYDKKPLYFLNQAPFSFDLSVYELYNSLTSGGCMISLSGSQIKDLRVLKEVLDKHAADIGVWVSTPSFLSLCAMDANFSAKAYTSLYQFVLIGEVFPKPLAKEILSRFPQSIVSNFYGPTEGTVAHTVIDLTHEIVDKYPVLPIGYSKPKSKVVIDDGEIVLVGPNISPGYINDPERSAKVFFTQQGERAYRTGDLGSLDKEGLLFFTGRKDFQIKLNGYRIELGDIEGHLSEISFLKDCCVIPKMQERKVAWLCAFVSLRDPTKFSSAIELRKAIKAELEEALPAYMIPKNYIVLERFPITENGKIDRRALLQKLDESP